MYVEFLDQQLISNDLQKDRQSRNIYRPVCTKYSFFLVLPINLRIGYQNDARETVVDPVQFHTWDPQLNRRRNRKEKA